MSLFILHEEEVILDAYRQMFDELQDAWTAHLVARSNFERELIQRFIREAVGTIVAKCAGGWLRDLRRREERRNLKRRRAAQRRCGYKPR